MPHLLSIGECMVELAPAGADTFRMGFAGDTFNTAWYARRLLPPDWRVGYCTRVGTDAISDRMVQFIDDAGIENADIARDPDRTVGLYMIQTEDGERHFSYWRGESAARRLAEDPGWLAGRLGRADVLFFSGITLAILPPEGRARLCAALAEARATGKRVVFDTNMRPRLWEDADALCQGIMAGAGVADIVLPSLDEEVAAFGDTDARAVADRYHRVGAGLVVVKNGGGEILASDNGARTRVRPPDVARPVDTTAAGDSFDGGFLAAHLTGAPLAAALTRAAALAARVVQAPGALVDPGSDFATEEDTP
ncbi:sugar kinase [Jhaorihella thermophila]|uniref:2-dehydro-3-deoxygluconokinase n=1 Tax=Jhaorihella thermophila TaxID=488547 RepID=A0A1H5UMC0_9RHOB|nr:sugar kinase [Jhaorihella thermophila]SEF76223.1 2-dehydro-3-deoxygluconokinase [Jhaorihella thermophila]